MTAASIAFMVFVLGLVWGGFVACLVSLARQKDEAAEPPTSPPVRRRG